MHSSPVAVVHCIPKPGCIHNSECQLDPSFLNQHFGLLNLEHTNIHTIKDTIELNKNLCLTSELLQSSDNLSVFVWIQHNIVNTIQNAVWQHMFPHTLAYMFNCLTQSFPTQGTADPSLHCKCTHTACWEIHRYQYLLALV